MDEKIRKILIDTKRAIELDFVDAKVCSWCHVYGDPNKPCRFHKLLLEIEEVL